MVLVTTNCNRHGHPEFVLEADEAAVPADQLRDLARTVEGMVAAGSAFRPEQTFQVGWMLTLVRRHADGVRLTLAEPDMREMPIRWVGGVTRTLRQMMLQVYMLDSVGLRDEADFPSVQHALLACTHYADADFFLERFAPRGPADTGWFVGCTRADHRHNDPANLRLVSAYEAYLHQRGIQGFAAFPVGSQVVVQRGGIEIARGGAPLKIVERSLLDEWGKRGGRE